MSDTNRVGIRFAKTAASEFPVALSPNQLQQLRYTGAPNLAYTPRTIQSTEIRSDRQISDLPLVGAEAGGDVNFELSAQAYDDVIESALLGAWVDPGRKAGAADITVITRTAGNTVVTLDDASDFVIGHIVRLSGVDGVGNGVFLVTAKSGQALTLGTVVDGSQVAGTVSNRAAAVFEVVGVGARSAGAFDITVASGVLSVVGPSGSFTNAMGDGSQSFGWPMDQDRRSCNGREQRLDALGFGERLHSDRSGPDRISRRNGCGFPSNLLRRIRSKRRGGSG